MRILTRTLFVLPFVVAAFVGPSALAADKTPAKKEGSFGTGKAGGAYLTKDQLRACLMQQDKLKSQDADLVKEQAALAAQKTEITRVGDELKGQLESVDRTKAEAVAGYNDAVNARDQQIDAYQTRVTAFNASVETNQAAHESFSQGCSSRRYFEEDEAAIRKGK